jgi:phosphate transport system substrate-binding protein
VLGGVVPIYNIPASTRAQVHGSGARGHLPRQDHEVERPRDRSSEPGVNLPNPTSRSSTARRLGTTYIFVDYLAKVRRSGRRRSAWRPRSTGPSGSAARATRAWRARQADPGSIGYVELIYAIQNKIDYGAVQNMAGEFVRAR